MYDIPSFKRLDAVIDWVWKDEIWWNIDLNIDRMNNSYIIDLDILISRYAM